MLVDTTGNALGRRLERIAAQEQHEEEEDETSDALPVQNLSRAGQEDGRRQDENGVARFVRSVSHAASLRIISAS